MCAAWSPRSWREKSVIQVPNYPDPEKLGAVEQKLRNYPPLVFAGEARRLRKMLTDDGREGPIEVVTHMALNLLATSSSGDTYHISRKIGAFSTCDGSLLGIEIFRDW